ncbi:unnamed protein product [Vicia faba]|uniref:Uncharacterized protein n=1 Tax=Vicia faba TaxID=3906 RepID=A0AAV1A9V8_VICFA|nr:unnamed protein product [Vicia faba]
MRYYRDFDGDYYYLEESDRNVYDEKDPTKDPSNEPIRSSYGFLSTDLKSYLYGLVKRILADNQVREEYIMEKIDNLAKESEESWVELKSDLKVEIKAEIRASEARVTPQVESVRIVVDYLGRTNVILDIGPFDIDTYTTLPISDVTIVVPSSDDATDIP